jgi:hypothetical protein
LARRLHAYGLIAKLPRTRRWRFIAYGRQAMGASPNLREQHFNNGCPNAAQAESSLRET